MSSGRLGKGVIAALMSVAMLGGALGCELIAKVDRSKIPNGEGGSGGGGGSTSSGAMDCTAPSDCPNPGNECLTVTCNAGKCGTDPVAQGTPVATQTAGDCKSMQCDGAGKAEEAIDDTDVPDDKKDCTDDVCTAGVPSNPPKMSGATCGNGLVCNGAGDCVGCVAPTDCPGKDDECQQRSCTLSVCGTKFTAAGTVTQAQTPGDCKKSQCDGAGNTVDANDSMDLPVDGKACTDDVCTAGVPSNPPTMAGVSCSEMGGTVCDGQSACVECITAATCPGQDTDCQKRTCVAGACGMMNVPVGTVTPNQTKGDCKDVVCNGSGGTTSANQDMDLPDDNNPCTNDICTGGVPSHTFKPSGTSCGGSLVCDAMGSCVGCVMPTDCPGMDTECQVRSCVGNMCGFTNTPPGTVLMAQTPGDCKLAKCDGMGGVIGTPDDQDLPVDGTLCTDDVCTNGVPSHPPVVSGTSCNDNGGNQCNGAGACVECLLAADCPGMDTDCHGRTCTAGACGVANTASGTPTSTQTPGDCQEQQCDGNGGVMSTDKPGDVPVDMNQCTNDVCTGGVPSNPPSMVNTSCNQSGGAYCDGTGMCVECNTGMQCPSGVCSSHACQAPSCNDGVKNGDETDTDCGGSCPTACALNQACLADSDCASALCVGKVCSQINGCDITNAEDHTGGADMIVAFGGANGLKYVPACIKVTAGTKVTFNGNFGSHPLQGGEVIGGLATPTGTGPFLVVTNSGTTKDFIMSGTGSFPYYCQAHVISANMVGVVFVVP